MAYLALLPRDSPVHFCEGSKALTAKYYLCKEIITDDGNVDLGQYKCEYWFFLTEQAATDFASTQLGTRLLNGRNITINSSANLDNTKHTVHIWLIGNSFDDCISAGDMCYVRPATSPRSCDKQGHIFKL